jgi:hypothetical protein
MNWLKNNWKDLLVIIGIALVVVIAFSMISDSCKQKPITPTPSVPDTIGTYKIEQLKVGIDNKLDSFKRGQEEALKSIVERMDNIKVTYKETIREHMQDPIDTTYNRVRKRLKEIEVRID